MLDGPRLAPLTASTPSALVVLIHGYGSNGHDLISIGAMIQPLLPEAAFFAPHAPSQIAGMAAAHQWWPIETFSAVERTAGAASAAPALDAFIAAKLESAGLASDRLLLIGFSQGAMLALHIGLRRPAAIAGIVAISGMLVAPERLESELRSRPPVLLVNGTRDDVVPFASMALAANALASAGVPVETHGSVGVDHSVGPDGLDAVTAFACRVLK